MTNPSTKSIKREIALVYGATLLITGGLALTQNYVGWLREYVLAIVAALFLYLPLEVLYKKGIDPALFGIHAKPLWRSIRHALIISLFVFPPYLLGFHFWQTHWLKNKPAVAEARLDQWPIDVQDAPKVRQLKMGEVRLHANRDVFWMQWHLPPGQVFEASIESEPSVSEYVVRKSHSDERTVFYRGRSDGRLAFRASGDYVKIDVQTGGDRLPAERLRVGTTLKSAPDMPYTIERSYWWVFNLIIFQFLLVALPEEVFYRGYLQSRLDQIFTKETKVFGVSVSVMSLVVTSTLFAVGHYVTVPSVHRLAVFFPSLLFGWMRRATGGILAPLTFHALCNLFVEFAALYYA